ncbi:MAG: hypothetical protein COU35_00630 [Candidatus Magasanikbacteria bacterium CG10_big_fil_rev_8_21_14_0_10_47_10]|uniref:Ribosomal RNA adenine methylase transferase N-terminal domain-containing protein n=1 Tax=Candidatus Magasanikbacteria bacterium CG10_big_fil_rev_8_21_14_0_10_47_10 TaxID=1974652 RepID=A0A2H0TRK5_9BACT|nr:MAG: hypothetical protein COU35_00630 [Candidatus Magasanikbacteria bacterium CG10_big_fil_rev_8_21_14_0_10_47_10]
MHPDPADLEQLKPLLVQAGIRPRRSSGQNFLRNGAVFDAAVAALDPHIPRVTELGAGPGGLTVRLLAAGFTVRAIERDRALVAVLSVVVPQTAAAQLTVVPADLREAAWYEGEGDWQLAGNIPYNVSGYILRRMVQLSPARAVLLVQKEVGQRLIAGPPRLSLLGLAVQLWGAPRRVRPVPRGSFWPVPAVDSVLVHITPHPSALESAARERILAYARPLFAGRRKQLGGSVRRTLGLDAAAAAAVLAAAGIAPQQRPQEVGVAKWIALASELERREIKPPSAAAKEKHTAEHIKHQRTTAPNGQ